MHKPRQRATHSKGRTDAVQTAQLRLTRPLRADDLSEWIQMQPQWLLVFGSVSWLDQAGLHALLREAFPHAVLTGCSTAGEISAQGVADGSLVLSAVRFDAADATPVEAVTELAGMDDSRSAGERLGQQLAQASVHAAIVLGLGVQINGSALIDGMQSRLGPGVRVSGGLAGDAGEFRRTLTLGSHGLSDRHVVAVGFRSRQVRLRHGCFHGWRPFGPVRRVTRSAGNVLHELDGQPALEVYKRYLGEYASGLPGTGLLFPFQMQGSSQASDGLIRTILSINEADGSLVLAGDITPQGYLRLMHASTDSLVEGAQNAAESAVAFGDGAQTAPQGLALLVSCVGRKLAMGARVEEEIEAVAAVLGRRTLISGFYSNGEISPSGAGAACSLHNQTMTITHLQELPT